MKTSKTTVQKAQNYKTASKFYLLSAACFLFVALFNIGNTQQFLSFLTLSCSMLTLSFAMKVKNNDMSEKTDGGVEKR